MDPTPRGARLPADFALSAEMRAYAEAKGLDPQAEFDDFCDYWRSTSGANARKLDWTAAWRVSCRRQSQRPGRKTLTHAPYKPPERPKEQERDHIAYFANRLLLKLLPLGTEGLAVVLPIKAQLVEWFVGLTLDGDPEATPRNFVRHWVQRVRGSEIVIPEPVLTRYRHLAADSRARQPFPAEMAR